jgi:hypothetical protein
MSFFVCEQTMHFLLLGLRYTVSILMIHSREDIAKLQVFEKSFKF